MKTSTVSRAIATLALCAFGLAALGSAKNPVERPVRVHGQNTFTINVVTGECDFQGSAMGTHMGLSAVYASGHVDAKGNFVGSGFGIAANGDLVFFEMPGSTWNVQTIGGTGRFENATGGWNPVSRTVVDQHWNADGTLSITYNYVGVGRITY
jgi:hypothetical protein